nr:disease resistance protein RGA2-like [Ziziphus jujuba var. spinosa]
MELPIPERIKNFWDLWNIRFCILLSLSLQVFLFLFASSRQRSRNTLLQVLLWSAYLTADWIATVAIGLISNSQTDSNKGNKDILVFWVSFLLLHLGGPDSITSYSLEDNELWLRRLFGLVLQVIGAGYTLFRTIPDNNLWLPTILVLLVGAIKYAERTASQHLASLDCFGSTALTKPYAGHDYEQAVLSFYLSIKPMADIVLSGIAEEIIGRIASAAVQEIGLLWSVKDELSELEETMSTTKAVLLDAEEMQTHNHQVRTWLKRLEDAVCEADDLMDEFNTEAALQQQGMLGNEMTKQVCTFFSASNQVAFRHKLGHKIIAIKEKLTAIRDDRNFHLEERHEETRVVTRGTGPTHSYVPEEEVIGRYRDRMAIMEYLMDAEIEENVGVIPIVGTGGLGKTTLAQVVFNDEKVEKHFDLRMWVYVCKSFNIKLLVEKIIKSATNKGLENLEMDQLQKVLQKEISGKRYLLILDDVWNENREIWLSLKILLSNCGKGSRIIITTRSLVVGEITSSMKPYILGRLNQDESWALFKKVAFNYGEEPKNYNISVIGKEIIEKCGGFPLAIRTIGRMLYFKNPEAEWSSFLKMEFSKIPQEGNDILPTLKLSYDNLPADLKRCFAFCKLFPKGHQIDIKLLINLWMALGFIKISDSTKSLVEVGNEYFMDLLWRSFFQELEEDDEGNKTCKMHALMHDLATQVGGARYAVLETNKKSNFNQATHHVSFDFHLDSSEKVPTTLLEANKIRTILLLRQSSRKIRGRRGQSVCDVIVSSFKSVRLLDLHNLGIKIVPTCIGKLKHLRYLDLSENEDIKMLPDSITLLYNLQTLKLSYCTKLQELPRDLNKLVYLVSLEIDMCTSLTHMPGGLGQLTNLQTLSRFVLKEGTSHTTIKSKHSCDHEVGELSDLMGLNNIRGKLSIINLGNGDQDSKAANLKDKQHLCSLCLCWHVNYYYAKLCDDLFDGHINLNYDLHLPSYLKDVEYEATLEGLQPHPNLKELCLQYYEGVEFPSWLPSHANLEYLFLKNSLKCQYLPPLNGLVSLKKLKLGNMLGLEYISNGPPEPSRTSVLLPALEILEFIRLPNLKGWWRRTDINDCKDGISMNDHVSLSFPRLHRLIIIGCPKLSFLPMSPNIKNLLVQNNIWKPFQLAVLTASTFSNLSFLALFKLKIYNLFQNGSNTSLVSEI